MMCIVSARGPLRCFVDESLEFKERSRETTARRTLLEGANFDSDALAVGGEDSDGDVLCCLRRTGIYA